MLREDIIFYLKTNPDPVDADVHVWAEENGYDVHEVETEIYKLATSFVKFLTGGRASDIGIDEEDVDPEELKLGIKVEKEHVDDVEIQKRIALDHLSENDSYYTKLLDLEKTFESK